MVWLVALLSFALCFVSVPPVIALSWKIGAVDVPSDWRRMHCKSIPRAGGLAVFTAFFVACCVYGVDSLFLACALGGGLLMLAVGLADDIFFLDAWVKLFFQLAVATAAVLGSGITKGWGTLLGVLWVVALTNAHNFVDGLDGLFAGCASIEGIALCLALLLCGANDNAAPPLFLALACLAFRYFNRYPAKTFAGDCGSGTVGFLLGLFSLPLFSLSSATFGALSPLLIFAYPLTDLFGAVLRRLMRGKSPFHADRGHLHHRIYDAGLTHPQCCGVLLGITAGLGTVGVLLSAERLLLLAGLSCLGAVLVLVKSRRFIVKCR